MQVLEGTVGPTAVEEGHIGSIRNVDTPATNDKGKAVIDTSPPVTPEPSKKEARQ